MRLRIDPQPPPDACIVPSLLYDHLWWADSAAWNEWETDTGGERYQLPRLVRSPGGWGDERVRAVFEDGEWVWEMEDS